MRPSTSRSRSVSSASGSSRRVGVGPEANQSTLVTPTIKDIAWISAIASPVICYLEITHCYSLLAEAFAARSEGGANWCTYATPFHPSQTGARIVLRG